MQHASPWVNGDQLLQNNTNFCQVVHHLNDQWYRTEGIGKFGFPLDHHPVSADQYFLAVWLFSYRLTVEHLLSFAVEAPDAHLEHIKRLFKLWKFEIFLPQFIKFQSILFFNTMVVCIGWFGGLGWTVPATGECFSISFDEGSAMVGISIHTKTSHLLFFINLV